MKLAYRCISFCFLGFALIFQSGCEEKSVLIHTDQVKMTYWLNNKRMAVSLTFDDTKPTHYQIGNILENNGLRGTFLVNPGIDWESTKENYRYLYQKGHEIGNHSFTHKNFTGIDSFKIISEIQRADSAILADLGFYPNTFVYPYNASNNKTDSIVFRYHLFSRISSPYGMDNRLMYDIGKNGRTIDHIYFNISDQSRDSTWVIISGHGISDMEFDVSEVFLDELCKAITKVSDIWVDKLETIAAYDYLRREISVHVKYYQPRLDISITGFSKEKYKNFQKLPITIQIPFEKKEGIDIIGITNDLKIDYSENNVFVTFDLVKFQHLTLLI